MNKMISAIRLLFYGFVVQRGGDVMVIVTPGFNTWLLLLLLVGGCKCEGIKEFCNFNTWYT